MKYASARITHLNTQQYQTLYQQSIAQPQQFWSQIAESFITWRKPWQTVMQGDFKSGEVNWFVGGELNVSENCLDRHLATKGDKVAFYWEGDAPNESKAITYSELHQQVCRFSNVLKQLGTKKGDKVCIYLPMIPEIVVAMLACTRIGAVHNVVFGGFSPDSLKIRIQDADCKIVITADEGVRGGKRIPLKANVDVALQECLQVQHVVVVKRTGGNIAWNAKDRWYEELMTQAAPECLPEPMQATDPLFILYTSGSTGKPKGILHTTGGYLVYATTTFHYIFDYHEQDIFWCTADCGWITGHTYLVYGPLANGATSILFEGIPNYPDFSRYWQIIDKYKVSTFYTSPTAIRALRREGESWLTITSRASLKLLGSVGEPINPEVWEWYYQEVGQSRCPIVDTWWQTETGGILISALPGATPLKPGSASWPFLGIQAAIVDDSGQKVVDNQTGRLVITHPWPGMMNTVYKDRARFINGYLVDVPGAYLTGDTAVCDAEGYYWIHGRNDDVIKVSGHRIGSEEVESALLTHHAVSEAAVVAIPHEIKGQAIYAFVTTKADVVPDDTLKTALINTVRQVIGPIATPEQIQWAKALPKTRSGKIMRRVLRKIACRDTENLGDLSTLIDPSVIQDLLNNT